MPPQRMPMSVPNAIRATRRIAAPAKTEAFAHGYRLLVQGQTDAAEAVFKRVMSVPAQRALGWLGVGLVAACRKQFAHAVDLISRALGSGLTGPHRAEALYVLAMSHKSMGRPNEALVQLRKLIEFDAAHVLGWRQTGLVQQTLGLWSESLASLSQALQLAPGDPEISKDAVVSCLQLHDYDCARSVLERALARFPADAGLHRNLAVLYKHCGEFDSAVAHFLRAWKLGEQAPELAFSLATCQRVTDENSAVMQLLRQALADPARKHEAALWFAMGKCHDDLGQFDAAFAAYQEANRLEHARQVYDRKHVEAEFDAIIAHFDAAWLARTRADAVAASRVGSGSSVRPIIVLGMPRSGTTLLEQFLSGHSHIRGAGEAEFWAPYTERSLAGQMPDAPTCASLGQAYWQALVRRAGASEVIVDKLPQNFLHLGLLVACCPQATLVHLQRDPVDTCLSIYFQRFSGMHPYAYDLDDIAHYYGQYRRLMAHWRQLLGDALIEVDYESLVHAPAQPLQQVLARAGLEWEAACLAHTEGTRFIATASAWQARQPLYDRSVGRWRQYAAHLTPLLASLARHGVV